MNRHMGQHCWNTPYLMTRNTIRLLVTGSLKPRHYFENDEEYLISKNYKMYNMFIWAVGI